MKIILENIPQLTITSIVFGMIIMILVIQPVDIVLTVPITIILGYFWYLKWSKSSNV